MIKVSHPNGNLQGEIQISGSKSESNRWLILQALYPEILKIQNLSNSEDTKTLERALHLFQTEQTHQHQPLNINVGHAGTAMRFLTAYFSIRPQSHIELSGSSRMHQRPIKPLVEALRQLGGQIEYAQHENYPPLFIQGKHIKKNKVEIQANISSQFISALLLIGAKLPNGLEINLKEKVTSHPYVEMTIKQIQSLGIQVDWLQDKILIHPKEKLEKQEVWVESDWSSASYWYAMAALSKQANISIKNFKSNSYQGDAKVVKIYEKYFGIKSIYKDDTLVLSEIEEFNAPDFIEINLNATPDLAQTIAVTCVGLKIKLKMTGLKTLKIKETDRIKALHTELKKLNVESKFTEDSLEIIAFEECPKNSLIKTYDDHRMAMSFAALSLKMPMTIEDKDVVKKSYVNFWEDLQKLGFQVET